MEEKRVSPLKAIRLKCLDCCCGSSSEVKLCTVGKCALYPFREGVNPNRNPKVYTEEQKAALISRLRKSTPTNTGEKIQNPVR